MTEDEMVGWHHWLDGHEFEQTPEVGDGQGGLVHCSPWGHKELYSTVWLNWTELIWRQMKMIAQQSQINGTVKTILGGKFIVVQVYLASGNRKISNKQPNLTSKGTRKTRTKKTQS